MPIVLLIAAGAVLYLGLHFFEPALAATWSYAHLGRDPKLVVLGVALVLVLPLAAVVADRLEGLRTPWPAATRRIALGAFAVLSVAFLLVGWFHPAQPLCIDSPWFAIEVWHGNLGCTRWYLTLATYTPLLRIAEWLAPFPVPARTFVPVLNAFVTAAAYLLFLASARRLGRDRFEVGAIALLVAGAFGNFQLIFHYMDVYPVAQLGLALYLWTALRTIDGDLDLVWMFLVAALVPLFYVGLVLIGPSVLVVLLAVWNRPGFWPQFWRASIVTILVAGFAMIPGYGIPFAFAPYLRDLVADSAAQHGYDPNSSFLPASMLFAREHLVEVASVLLLIDGIGVLLCATAGWALVPRLHPRRFDAKALFLVTVLAPQLAYLFAMDAIWGTYLDWDLFSYVAIPLSFLGGYALMIWGRPRPTTRALLTGLVLAAVGVHLLARTNALELEYKRHVAETPMHPTLPNAPP